MPGPTSDSACAVTELLHRLAGGERSVEQELIPAIYRELKRLAAAQLRRERPGHSLQCTALVHEAYLRLTGRPGPPFNDRVHFFAVAANVMRRILVDHARRRNAGKRRSPAGNVPWDDQLLISGSQCDLIEALDQALQRLAEFDPRKAEVVELRYFGGLTEEQIAQRLGVTSRTIKRDWAMARAWLLGELKK